MEQPTLFRTGTCTECGDGFPVGPTGIIPPRCRPCARERALAQKRAHTRNNYQPVKNERTCRDCGTTYRAPGRDTKSLRCPPCRTANKAAWKKAWAEANADKAREAKRRWFEANRAYVKNAKHARRVLERDAKSDRFTREDVFERDGWTCQICRAPLCTLVNPLDNRAPTVDHVIPIRLGGTHTLDNVQAACFGCNRAKGHRLK